MPPEAIPGVLSAVDLTPFSKNTEFAVFVSGN